MQHPLMSFFFFFKQKTAYEMRISDWSSDVCSSDLVPWAVWPPGRQCWCRFPRSAIRLQAAHRRARSAGAHSGGGAGRSEEHTSELQSLMRISYAVFCLKKKKQTKSIYKMKDQNVRINTQYSDTCYRSYRRSV